MKAIPAALLAAASSFPVYAQTAEGPDGFSFAEGVPTAYYPVLTGAQFVIAILSGLLLAYCFQWLLTNLSVAVGVSALQGVTDPAKRDKARREALEKEAKEAGEGGRPKPRKDGDSGWEDTAVKAESGIGLWAMITSSIALFLACWLAIELIRIQGNVEAVILGLVIWSAFLGTMIWLEGAAASTLLGYVTSTAKSGVRALLAPVKAAAGSIAGGSAAAAQRKETVQTAEEVTAAIRRELFGEEDWQIEAPSLKDRVADYVRSNVKPKALDVAHVGQQVKDLLTDPELVEMAKRGELQNLDRSHFAEIVSGRTDLDRGQVERLVDALQGTWNRFLGEHAAPADAWSAGGGDGQGGEIREGAGAIMPWGASEQAPQGMMARYKGFKEFLRNTGREELSPERLEQEVKTLVLDPRLGLSQLKQHIKELDRESLVKALGARQDMTPEEANRIADQIDLARSRALSAKEQAEHRAHEMRDKVLARIRDHVYSLGRPELDYEGFEGDFKKLLDDPKAGYAALKARLQGLDRETLIAVLGSRPGVSREEAEKMVGKAETAKEKLGQAADKARAGVEKVADRILEAKQAVLDRAQKVEDEARRRLEEAKRSSLEQAEAARKVTAAAAWWLLIIAAVSGAAAALGALTAAAT